MTIHAIISEFYSQVFLNNNPANDIIWLANLICLLSFKWIILTTSSFSNDALNCTIFMYGEKRLIWVFHCICVKRLSRYLTLFYTGNRNIRAVLFCLFVFKSFHPKHGDNATKTQRVSENEREIFRNSRKPNSVQETMNKPPSCLIEG